MTATAITLGVTVLVMVAAPLWMFRYDIAARLQGKSTEEYLNDTIRALERDIKFSRVKGSPEWCKTEFWSYILSFAFIGAINFACWYFNVLKWHSSAFNVGVAFVLVMGVATYRIRRARTAYRAGHREIVK